MTWEEVLPHGNKGIPKDKVTLGASKLIIHREVTTKMNCTHIKLLFDAQKLMVGLVPTNEQNKAWALSKSGRNRSINIGALLKGYGLEGYTGATYSIHAPSADGDIWTINLNEGEVT